MGDTVKKSGARPRVFWLISLVAILGGIAWLAWPANAPEPVYEGQPASVWMDMYFQPKYHTSPISFGSAGLPIQDEAASLEQKKAAMALRIIGTNAIPYYLKLLDTPTYPWAERFLELSWSSHFPQARAACIRRVSQSWQNPVKAEMGFQLLIKELGNNGSPALQELLPLYNTADKAASARITEVVSNSNRPLWNQNKLVNPANYIPAALKTTNMAPQPIYRYPQPLNRGN